MLGWLVRSYEDGKSKGCGLLLGWVTKVAVVGVVFLGSAVDLMLTSYVFSAEPICACASAFNDCV